jgi:hypothetical protein
MDTGIWPECSQVEFFHDSVGDISFSELTDEITGDVFDIYVTLERLPDAPGAAALYYLNAVADQSVIEGTSVALTPTGPTFAAGTSVSALADSNGELFIEWTGDVPTGHETDNPLAITMDVAKSITATFGPA